MEWIIGNSFLILVLLVCVGMHFFGHGHGHGKHHGIHNHDDEKHRADNPDRRN